LCISFTRPALPKSISDIADSPMPETSSTRPSPYLSCVTRSPGASTSSGRLPAPDRDGDERGRTEPAGTGDGRTERRRGGGAPPLDELLRISRRKRDSGVQHRLSPGRTDDCPAQVQPLTGPGDARHRPAAVPRRVRKDRPTPAYAGTSRPPSGDEHHRKPPNLRGVQGHQRDHTGGVLRISSVSAI